ncbi:hypothetical protein [Paraburkholderia sp. GAS199]|uniref:hypothetical protein n=1 Tax=Paraburkholderia sp. GAS199 TaxID=3035126 RepID=UPI003D21CF91
MKLMLGIVIAVAIVLAFVGYQLFTGNRDDQSNDAESGNTATQDARTTTGTIAPFTPTQSTQSAGQNTAARGTPNANATANVAPPKSGNSGNSVKVPTPAPSAPFALATPPALALTPAKPAPTPVLPVTPVAPPAPQFRDAAQAMQTARQAIRTNDISTAQAALGAAQTLQPGNADAQSLLNDIKPLAARRDAALQAAQTCVAQQSWPCARQHANEALTIDTGNTTAKTILERVIRETGWAPLNLHGATATTPQTAPLTQQAPSPNNNAPATASRSGPAAADVNAAEARERAIRDSGWSRSSAAGAGAKPSASAPAAMAAATTTATSTSTSPGK